MESICGSGAKGGKRQVSVTAWRTDVDFVGFIQALVQKAYVGVQMEQVVLDNLSTHSPEVFAEILGVKAAHSVLERV